MTTLLTLPGMIALEGVGGFGKSLAAVVTGDQGNTARVAAAVAVQSLDPLAPDDCPKCGQNGWLANDEDGALTVCENCGWDIDTEGYIEGRG